jgi:hypothetical protein
MDTLKQQTQFIKLKLFNRKSIRKALEGINLSQGPTNLSIQSENKNDQKISSDGFRDKGLVLFTVDGLE